MAYVDSFVLAVPQENLEAYRKMARKAGKVWMKHGALQYIECVADDVQPGKSTSFPQAVKLKEGEVVVISYAIYQSRKHRDSVMAKVMKDPLMIDVDPKSLPFDAKRMFWGGFKPIVSL